MNGPDYYRRYEPLFKYWRIERSIGHGASGEVFEINCTAPDGKVYRSAMKAVSIPGSAEELKALRLEGMSDDAIRNFFDEAARGIERECSFMARFNGHPNIVGYEDHIAIRHADGIGMDILIKMPLLIPFTEYQARCELAETDVIRFGIHMCNALEECHSANIIHRDIKPENIFYDGAGYFKLGDFGIARELDKTRTGLTKTGTLIYMAPEIYSGEPYGKSVDTYSLGLVLYKLLNHNRIPFTPPYPTPLSYSDNEHALEVRMTGATLPYPDGTNDKELCDIVLRACEYDPLRRFPSASDMKQALMNAAKKYGVSPQDPDTTFVIPADPTIFNDLNAVGAKKKARTNVVPKPHGSKKKKRSIPSIATAAGRDVRIRHGNVRSPVLIAVLLSLAVLISAVTVIAITMNARKKDALSPSYSTIIIDTPQSHGWPATIECALSADGTLFVNGSGKMADFGPDEYHINPFYGVEINKIVIGEGIDHIGARSFGEGTKIRSVNIGSAKSIGEYAFWNCIGINSLDLSGVTHIGKAAFIRCGGLEMINLSDAVSIGDNAFEKCASLTEVNIPDCTTNIGTAAFADCGSLHSINVSGGNRYYSSADGVLFDGLGITLITYPAGKTDREYTVPETVTSIGTAAFYGSSAQSITLPASCSGISGLAFAQCKDLRIVTINARDVIIASDAFEGCSDVTIRGIPGSPVHQYVQTYADRYRLRFEPLRQ